MLERIDDGDNLRVLSETLFLSGRDERPEFVDIDGWSPVGVLHVVEVAHTDFTEITLDIQLGAIPKPIRGHMTKRWSDRKDVPWMVFVEVGPMVVGTTS